VDQEDQKDESYIPQGFVIGAFLVIFCAQVGVNYLHALRNGRRRRRFLEMQFPHPLPQRDQEGDRGFNEGHAANTNAREGNARDNAEGPAVAEVDPGIE
jgi:hypothetical protein